jgi:hypothetical protein
MVLIGLLTTAGELSGEAEAEVVAKELEHTSLQQNLDKELQELNKRLEQKEVKRLYCQILNAHLRTPRLDFLESLLLAFEMHIPL